MMDQEGLEDTTGAAEEPADDSFLTDLLTDTFDFILSALAAFSPFILVRGLVYYLTRDMGNLWLVLDLMILRPVGWVGSWITTEWVINKFRGTSET